MLRGMRLKIENNTIRPISEFGINYSGRNYWPGRNYWFSMEF